MRKHQKRMEVVLTFAYDRLDSLKYSNRQKVFYANPLDTPTTRQNGHSGRTILVCYT